MASSFLLSRELIYLMTWLLKNEKSRLKVLIKDALDSGLSKELDSIALTAAEHDNEILHEAFVNFLVYLENALIDTVEKQDRKRPVREQLVASIKDLNVNSIDMQTLMISIRQAEHELTSHQGQEGALEPVSTARELLLEKVLKNWKPSKKEPVH